MTVPLLALALAAPPAPAEVVERILVVVDGRPITLTEVTLAERVRGLEPAAALEALVDERLMFREAGRLPQATVTAEEEETAWRGLRERLGETLARAHEPDLRRMVRRQAAILKYVEFRFRPQVRVEEEDVRRAFETELGGDEHVLPYEEIAPALRQRLADEQLGDRIEAWVRELRESAEIRYNPRTEAMEDTGDTGHTEKGRQRERRPAALGAPPSPLTTRASRLCARRSR